MPRYYNGEGAGAVISTNGAEITGCSHAKKKELGPLPYTLYKN